MSNLLAHLFGPRFELAHPWALLTALLVVPIVWWSRRAAGRVTFSSLAALPSTATWRTRLAWLPDALVGLAALCLAVGFAGPRAGLEESRIRREGIAIAMVVDTSSSMLALDLSPDAQHEQTRLQAVMKVFDQFVRGSKDLRGRPDDLIGLVSFARYADTRSPLTIDHDNLLAAAHDLDIVTDPSEDGTAVGDGLALAIERLREAPVTSRVAILLTDGVSNAGEIAPMAAAELAHDSGVKVYTVGAGTNGTAKIKLKDPNTGEVQEFETRVEIDEDTLRAIADRTGGQYFRATDFGALRQVYKQIDALERSKIDEDRYGDHREYYPWLVAAAMIAIAIACTLRASFLRRLP
ncbi:MAG TPA: VWA domain-containing protein [Kofleriaceae bacterium]|nr:VWA domain-containing protein [Kofleriaceae bacterium]